MSIFNFFKRPLLPAAQNKQIVEAIRAAEMQTSGEIRVYIESRCRFVDPVERAREIFVALKMHETAERNAVLIYVAMRDRQMAIWGDEGIHQRVEAAYWQTALAEMKASFSQGDIPGGISKTAAIIGETLRKEFPYSSTDKNELPDQIVFGR